MIKDLVTVSPDFPSQPFPKSPQALVQTQPDSRGCSLTLLSLVSAQAALLQTPTDNRICSSSLTPYECAIFTFKVNFYFLKVMHVKF